MVDANVLGPALPRNIALTLAECGLYRPRWSGEILAETERYISSKAGAEAAQRNVLCIQTAFPEGSVEISSSALERLSLPDEDDRHVLAAAIKVRAQLIVTDNLSDFPSAVLEDFEIEAISADAFFADTMTLDTSTALASISAMRRRLNDPTITPDELILKCERSGLLETSALLDAHKELI